LITFKMLLAGALLAGPVILIDVPSVQADPLASAEVKYINDVRQAIQISQDGPDQAKSDAELLSEGRMACHDRALGAVGVGKTGIGPVITTWAFADLCPNG
jgi:hypothetical protein